jgi:hypothetical protein
MKVTDWFSRNDWAVGIFFVFGILFGLATVLNLFDSDSANAAATASLSVFLIGLALHFRREGQARDDFEEWLDEHGDALLDGDCVDYKGLEITGETRVAFFRACFSYVIFAAWAQSRYLVVGEERRFVVATLYSLITFVFGWWSLPFGPILTVVALHSNLRGGKRMSVHDLLIEIEKRRNT